MSLREKLSNQLLRYARNTLQKRRTCQRKMVKSYKTKLLFFFVKKSWLEWKLWIQASLRHIIFFINTTRGLSRSLRYKVPPPPPPRAPIERLSILHYTTRFEMSLLRFADQVTKINGGSRDENV